jgi:hypothetical protein
MAKYEVLARKVDGSVESFGIVKSVNAATRKIESLGRRNFKKDSVYVYFYFIPSNEK